MIDLCVPLCKRSRSNFFPGDLFFRFNCAYSSRSSSNIAPNSTVKLPKPNPAAAIPENPHDDYWRMDKLLKRKAEQGVRIYVLLWSEPVPFVNNFSREAEATLTGLHQNIKVVRADADARALRITCPWNQSLRVLIASCESCIVTRAFRECRYACAHLGLLGVSAPH